MEDLIISLQGGIESDNYSDIRRDRGQESDGDDEVVAPWEVE